MITVKQFSTECDWMILCEATLIGPINKFGNEIQTSYEIRHHRDQIYNTGTHHGEKDVSHFQVEGTIISFPDVSNIRPYEQTTLVPRSVQVDTRTSSGTKVVKTAGYGLFHFGEAYVVSLASFYSQIYVKRVGSAVHIFRVSGYLTEPGKVKSYRHVVIDNITITNENTYTCSKTAQNYSLSGGMFVSSGPWNQPRSGGDIEALEAELSRWEASSLSPTVEFVRLFSDGNPSLASAYDELETKIANYLRAPVNFQFTTYGELAAEAAQSFVGNDLNMIEFLSDLRHPTEMIPKLDNLKKVFRDKDKLSKMKRVSGEYLRLQYGALPTVRDVRKIWGCYARNRPYFDKNGYQTVHAGVTQGITWLNTPVDITRRVKLAIAVHASDWKQSLHAFDQVGLLPNADRLWDLVPYSFVMDWILPVGSLLEARTAKKRLERFDIQYVTMSHKEIAHIHLGAESLAAYYGEIQLVQYHRWTSDHCPVPTLPLQFNTTGSSHWLEASSLILQRR